MLCWAPLAPAAHPISDQFVLPAFGGVGFETLDLGRNHPIDVLMLARIFGARPPMINAGSVDEAEQSLRRIPDDRGDEAGSDAADRDWIPDYHSAERVASLQLEACSEIIAT